MGERPGLFTTLRVRAGQAWLLEGHLARLASGASALGLPPPPDDLVRVIAHEAEGMDDARVRVLLPPEGGPVVTAQPYAPPVEPWRLRPVLASPDEDTVRLKTTHRVVYEQAKREASDADDALLTDATGAFLETTVANVFFVEEGGILTPPATAPLLAGIARRHVLEAARSLGLDAREATLDADRARRAEAVFLTNALFLVHPVAEIAGVARYRAGRLVRRLTEHLVHATPAIRIIHGS